MRNRTLNCFLLPRSLVMMFRRLLPISVVAVIFRWPSVSTAEEPFRFPDASYGKGKLQYINDLPVLTVEGTPEEIGKQIGILAVKPAPQILNIFHEFLKLRGLEKAWPWLVRVDHLMAAQIPADHVKEME